MAAKSPEYLRSYSNPKAAPITQDIVFRKEFKKAVITGAGIILGITIMTLGLKAVGVIPRE